jgi:hypothetical protein
MKSLVAGAVLCAVVAAGAFAAGDILGISKENASRDFVFSIGVGQFPVPDGIRSKIKAASPEARAAMVESAILWAKAYAATPQFEAAYQEFRNGYKPEEPGTEGSAEDVRSAREYYREQLAEWSANYPATGREALKIRLREFLAESRSVDYAAQLVRRDGKMRFAKEEYENDRSSEWKLCYRAGKVPVEKARQLATTWLSELEGKK